MRLFLAVTLDDETKEELAEMQNELKKKIKGIRWVNPELLHITLKFLGETDEAVLVKLGRPFEELAEKITPFNISLDGLGAFPSLKDPRVIWLGIKEGAKELFYLSEAINEILKELTPSFTKSDRKDFRPHLTIGRRDRKGFFEASPSIFKEKWAVKSRLYIESFSLINSILRPAGPQYIPLQEFLLKKK